MDRTKYSIQSTHRIYQQIRARQSDGFKGASIYCEFASQVGVGTFKNAKN